MDQWQRYKIDVLFFCSGSETTNGAYAVHLSQYIVSFIETKPSKGVHSRADWGEAASLLTNMSNCNT
jgi:hypothetical protein